MPNPNPLNALRKASSISSGSPKPSQISQSVMPLAPWGGLSSTMSGTALLDAQKAAPGALQGLQQAISPAQETLGEVGSEYTPVGGEGLYNVARAGLRGIVDPVEEAYRALLSRGGK